MSESPLPHSNGHQSVWTAPIRNISAKQSNKCALNCKIGNLPKLFNENNVWSWVFCLTQIPVGLPNMQMTGRIQSCCSFVRDYSSGKSALFFVHREYMSYNCHFEFSLAWNYHTPFDEMFSTGKLWLAPTLSYTLGTTYAEEKRRKWL